MGELAQAGLNAKEILAAVNKETVVTVSQNYGNPVTVIVPDIVHEQIIEVPVPVEPLDPYDDAEPCPNCDMLLTLPYSEDANSWYQCPDCGNFFYVVDSDSDFVAWHAYTVEEAMDRFGAQPPDTAPMAGQIADQPDSTYKAASVVMAEVLKANYGAKAGETIQGNLARGGDGKFTSGGGGDPVAGSAEDKAAIRARLDAAKAKAAAAKAPKPKKGKAAPKGKAKAAPKGKKAKAPKKTKAEIQAAKDDMRSKNLSEIFSDDGIDEAMTNVRDDPTTVLNADYQSQLESHGFIKTDATTGLTTLTPAGKALMKAAENDDTKAMNRAVMQGKATVIGNKAVSDKKAAATQAKADALRAKADKLQSKKEISVPENNLSIIKQADGKYRWITFSSSSFKDRDQEIFSQAALEKDVARADADGDYGPLRWFHVPGLDLGDCDFNAMSGRLLVESGTFRNEWVAKQIAELPPEALEVSLGVYRGITDPDPERVYHNIRRFERSIMPAGPHASNLFTGFMTTTIEKDTQMLKTKIEALTKMLGGGDKAEALVNDLVAQASTVEKQALEAGIVTKAAGDVEAAAAAAEAEEPEDLDGDNDDDSVETVADMSVVEMATLITNVVMACLQQHGTVNAAAKAAAAPPPAPDMAEVTKAASEIEILKNTQAELLNRLTKAEGDITTYKTALTKAQADLAELSDDTPKIVKSFRASQSSETVVPNSTVKNRAPFEDEYEKIAAEAVNAYSNGGF